MLMSVEPYRAQVMLSFCNAQCASVHAAVRPFECCYAFQIYILLCNKYMPHVELLHTSDSADRMQLHCTALLTALPKLSAILFEAPQGCLPP